MKPVALLVLLLLSSPWCPAQTELQRRPAARADYILGPGDQFTLHVDDMEEISDKPLRVDPSGFIDLPLAGRVEAAGLTLEQLKAELRTRLARYVTAPQISINLTESISQPVSVIGQVNAPGVQQLHGTRRLVEVLSMSGGLKPDAGPGVIVTREPQWGPIDAPGAHLDPVSKCSTVTLPVDALLSSSGSGLNILIRPNDVISVPRAELVYILGDVRKAGGFELSTHGSISLLHALTLAEGLAPDNAAGRSRILRSTEDGAGTLKEIPVDVPRILAGNDPDIRLQPNDVLFVPHSGMKVASRRALEAAVGITSGILIYRR